MAEQLYFGRHTKVFLEQGTNIWEIPVMDGFSFSQATNTSEVTLAEMESAAGVSRRGRMMFNDSYAPAEWSFSTYVRPFIASANALATEAVTGKEWETTVLNNHCIEEALWANFVAVNSWTPPGDATSSAWTSGITYGTGATGTIIDFTASNRSILGTFNLYFEMGSCSGDTPVIYKIEGCVANSVGIDFDIDGIAMLNWSGFGSLLSEEITTVPIVSTITEGIDLTSNFIRNRLTTLAINAVDTTSFPGGITPGEYNVVLTGGSINFENNITFLTPDTLCKIDQPIGHVTGGRTIGGSFTCYVNTDDGATHDLWEDLMSATDIVTNEFGLVFSVGGAQTPSLAVTMPTCHLEVPSHSIEDVISLEVTFHALPSVISGTDEATVKYLG